MSYLTYHEEFRLHGSLSVDRQEALIDLLEQVQERCEQCDNIYLDTPAEGTPERVLFDAFYDIQNMTYGE